MFAEHRMIVLVVEGRSMTKMRRGPVHKLEKYLDFALPRHARRRLQSSHELPGPAPDSAHHDELFEHVHVCADGPAAVSDPRSHCRRLPGQWTTADPHCQWVAPGYPRSLAVTERRPRNFLPRHIWYYTSYRQIPPRWWHQR